MRVLVIGSGGREHALCATLAKSPLVNELFCAPGNGGTEKVAKNIPIAVDDIAGLVDFAKEHQVSLVVPGPELPLTLGIADAMREADIPCFGPDAFCARLEGSKAFAKELMAKANIPTAKSHVFNTAQAAKEHVRAHGVPVVIKADGLAAGKGVIVAESMDEAILAIDSLLAGEQGRAILVEDKLEGEEASLLCLCSGETALPLPSAQDHKTVFDDDKGPNTGGMGAYSPAPVLPDSRLEEMADLVIRPVLRKMAEMGHPFQGILYAGLMMTKDGPKVLEYNVRFGDPECQAILPRMKSDLAAHILAATKGQLADEKPLFTNDACLGVVLAAKGYPGAYPKGMSITGMESAEEPGNVHVFHSGTKSGADGLKANGGRVLCVSALGENLAQAQKNAYAALEKIQMPNAHFRKDIGAKGLKR